MSTTHTINLQEATDDSQSASIAAIKTKTDKITITSNLNLNTMNDVLTVATAINNTQNEQLAMTSESSMKTAIDLNSAKNTYPTADATKMGNISITSAVDLNELNSRFPRQNILRIYALTTADLYIDEKVKFNWDGVNRQLRFWILNIPSGEYMVGGVEKWNTTNSTRVANYISQNVSTYYHYFTSPQLSGPILNSAFNLNAHYTKATYFLTAYNEYIYPSYEITLLMGWKDGFLTVCIKRFN